MIFPIEIWEVIFSYCEAKDLIKCKSVCVLWNQLIPNHLKNNDKWYKQCMKDIPLSDLNMILEKKLPYSDGVHFEPYIKNHKIWRAVHNSWTKWTNLSLVTDYSIEKIYAVSSYELETITCIATSGSLIAIGTNDGYIRFYNMTEKKRIPMYVADHGASVCDVQILEYDEYIVGISVSYMNTAKFWNVLQKTLICQQHADIISVSHGFCYLLKGNILTRKGLNSIKMYTFDDCDPQFKAIIADKDEVFLWSSKGLNLHLVLEEDEWKYEYYNILPLQQKFGQYKVFKSKLATYMSYDGILSISVNYREWISYDIFSFLLAKPTCVYYYSKIFIIGLDIGDIYLYYIDDLNELEHMDFSLKGSSLKVEICESPISSLNILEHKLDQFIIATCEKYIYVVKFCFS